LRVRGKVEGSAAQVFVLTDDVPENLANTDDTQEIFPQKPASAAAVAAPAEGTHSIKRHEFGKRIGFRGRICPGDVSSTL
jgi:hypothetical protein